LLTIEVAQTDACNQSIYLEASPNLKLRNQEAAALKRNIRK